MGASRFATRTLIILFFISSVVSAATTGGAACSAGSDSLAQATAVKVFPDGYLDWDYVKANIPYVNYVRDRMEAELYLLVTWQGTGSGGTEYTITLVGQGRFAGMNDTLVTCSKPTDSSETARAGVVRTLKMALMRYVARTPIGEDIAIAYRGNAKPTEVRDKWDNWVFSLSCSPSISGSEVAERLYVSGRFSADRVTPALKMSYRVSGSYSETEQDLPSKTIHLIKRYGTFDGLVVKSFGDHWGVGLIGDALAQTYQNKKRYAEISPAVEYSIFPYSQSTRRELALFAQVIYTDVLYQEMTIYDKTAEKLWSYQLSLPASIKEPWGNIYSSISFRQYSHDANIYRLSILATVEFQITKGLWFDVSSSYYRFHDIIDQPRRQLTDEEILLNLKSLASTYEYGVGIGLTYTFGSIYTNIVNPRFFGD